MHDGAGGFRGFAASTIFNSYKYLLIFNFSIFMLSPQAVLPEYRTISDALFDITRAKVSNINSPRQVVLTGGADLVFDARDGNTLGDRRPVSKLLLHNLGANKMYYAMNMNVASAVGTYHDIFAPGSAALDGLGSIVNLSTDQPTFVTVKGTAGDIVSVIICYPTETFI